MPLKVLLALNNTFAAMNYFLLIYFFILIIAYSYVRAIFKFCKQIAAGEVIRQCFYSQMISSKYMIFVLGHIHTHTLHSISKSSICGSQVKIKYCKQLNLQSLILDFVDWACVVIFVHFIHCESTYVNIFPNRRRSRSIC